MHRYFKCIGREEDIVYGWASDFKIGKDYKMREDPDMSPDRLCLFINKRGDYRYVDIDQFKEVFPVGEYLEYPIFATNESADFILQVYQANFNKKKKFYMNNRFFRFEGSEDTGLKTGVVYKLDRVSDYYENGDKKSGYMVAREGYHAECDFDECTEMQPIVEIANYKKDFIFIPKVSRSERIKMKKKIKKPASRKPKYTTWANDLLVSIYS